MSTGAKFGTTAVGASPPYPAAAAARKQRPMSDATLSEPPPISLPPAAATLRRAWPALVAAHLIVVVAAGTASAEHFVVDGIWIALSISGARARGWGGMLFPVWLTAVLYRDLLPIAVPFRGPVHIADLYAAELEWFGYETPAGRRIPCDWFQTRHLPVVDLVCGLPYLGFQLAAVAFAAALARRDARRMRTFLVAYLFTHFVGFSLHIVFPAAPPWYVERYGLGPPRFDVPGDAAGLARVDDLLGLNLARGLYDRSTNVFGAVPSLHTALFVLFPLVSRGLGIAWFGPSLAAAAIIGFGAVYFRHHYVIDVLAGVVFAGAAYGAAVAWIRSDAAKAPAAAANEEGNARR